MCVHNVYVKHAWKKINSEKMHFLPLGKVPHIGDIVTLVERAFVNDYRAQLVHVQLWASEMQKKGQIKIKIKKTLLLFFCIIELCLKTTSLGK